LVFERNTGDTAFRWCNNEANGSLGTLPRKQDKLSGRQTAFMTYRRSHAKKPHESTAQVRSFNQKTIQSMSSSGGAAWKESKRCVHLNHIL
jgi:hypothetical protein